MKRLAIVILGLAACAKQPDHKRAPQIAPKAPALPAMPSAQSPMRAGKAATEMKLIPIPKDKAQLARLVAMGYTIHQNHMHPPGVKSCPFDKKAGSLID